MKRLISALLLLALLLAGCSPADYGEAAPDADEGEKEAAAVDPTLRNADTDLGLSSALRVSFAGLNDLYHLDELPGFAEGTVPEVTAMANYVSAYRLAGEDPVAGDVLEETAKSLFDVSYGLTAADQVMAGEGNRSYNETALVRLAAYQAADEGDHKRVTAKLLYYNDIIPQAFWDVPETLEYYHFDEPSPLIQQVEAYRKQNGGTFYQAAQGLLNSGAKLEGEPQYIQHISYLSEDGVVPVQFISCVHAALENGSYVYAEPVAQQPGGELLPDPEEWNEDLQTAVDPAAPGGAEDGAITAGQRTAYNAVAQQYQLDSMREFKAGEQAELWSFIYYVIALYRDEVYYEDEAYCYGETVEKAASLFGWSYGLEPKEKVTWKAGGGADAPDLYELVAYGEEQQNGQKLITLKLKGHECYFDDRAPAQTEFTYTIGADYTANQLAIYQKMQAENLSYYDAAVQLVLGEGNLPEQATTVYHLSYLTEDGVTPIRFVSFNTARYDSENGGYSYWDEAAGAIKYHP